MGSLLSLGQPLGLSRGETRFLLCFFGSIPCAHYHTKIHGTNARHWFAFLTGAVLSVLAFGFAANWHMYLPIFVTYFAMLLFRKWCGLITFIFTFAFLIGCHVYYMSGDAWKAGNIDFTGALMILTLKLTSCAMNYQDGASVVQLSSMEGTGDVSSEPASSESQKKASHSNRGMGKHTLERMPTLLELLGYSFCDGTMFAGPAYEMKEYLSFSERTGVWDPKVPVLGKTTALIQPTFIALLSVPVYVLLSAKYPVSRFTEPVYWQWSLWQRIKFMFSAVFAVRWKYYFVWSISEITMVVSELGYGGPENYDRWERACNVHPFSIEFATSGVDFPRHWNITVSNWLRLYVYERLAPKGKKPGFLELLVTQFISGIWHGLYPGQISYFVQAAIFIAGSKVIYKWQQMIPAHNKMATLAGAWLHGTYAGFCNNYSALGFLLFTAKDTWNALLGLYLLGTIVPVAILIIGNLLPPRRKAKGSDSVAEKKEL